MGINIGEEPSELVIYKDEKGRYSCRIGIQEPDEAGNYKYVDGIYKKVVFKKGIELKNKTKIKIIKGWYAPYRIPTEEKNNNGGTIYKKLDKYQITEFEILEEGTDEMQKTKQSKQEPQDSFAFDIGQDELPF